MAYQHGTIRLKGTLDTVTFYKMGGEYHVRTKSSLTGKKFWKHPSFTASRESCRRFATGNKLASRVYQSLPAEKQQYFLFCQLKTIAIAYIKKAIATEHIIQLLEKHVRLNNYVVPRKPRIRNAKKLFPYASEINQSFVALSIGRFLQLEKQYGRDTLLCMAEYTTKHLHQQTIIQAALARA